jgi:hypothetical protein
MAVQPLRKRHHPPRAAVYKLTLLVHIFSSCVCSVGRQPAPQHTTSDLQHAAPNMHHGSAADADGRLARRICFTTPLSGSMGPKQAECEEEYTLTARSADAFLVSMAARTPNVGALPGLSA